MSPLDCLRQKYPRPYVDDITPYFITLAHTEFSGRELVFDLLNSGEIKLMVEVGSFLCGSATQWLSCSDSLEVITIDPYDFDIGSWIKENWINNHGVRECFSTVDVKGLVRSLKVNGGYLQAIANAKEYGARMIPMRAKSPAALHEISSLGITPDIVYFDSDKLLNDLQIAHDLWPNAILCGDDWNWGDGFPVRKLISEFCQKNQYTYSAKDATWVIEKVEDSDFTQA